MTIYEREGRERGTQAGRGEEGEGAGKKEEGR